MSEGKRIDGIKKLSKDEVKKARKILLDYIGEDSAKKNILEGAGKVKKAKSMDGILGGINFRKKDKPNLEVKDTNLGRKQNKKEREALKKELGFADKSSVDSEKKEDNADKNIGGAFMRMAEKSEKKKQKNLLRKEIKERDKKEQARTATSEREKEERERYMNQGALRIEQEKKDQINKELEEKRKKIIEEKKRKEKEARKTAKIKEEIQKEKKHIEKVKKEEAEKKRIKKIEDNLAAKKKREKDKKEKKKRVKKKIKLYKHRVHKRIVEMGMEIKAKKKKITISILLLIIVSLLLYLFFVLLLVKANPDNRVTRFLADLLPVPALISSTGVLEYYDYLDKKTSLNSQLNISDSSTINKVFALDFVLGDLVSKYGINYSNENFKSQVENSILYDLDVNNVGIKRIGKIKGLIDEGSNFVQVSEKYGDQVDKIDFKSEEDAVKNFGEKLSGLRIDEVSDVVVHDDGYYIFKRYKKNNSFSLSYVYIASVGLDEYLNEEAVKLKIWSLVD